MRKDIGYALAALALMGSASLVTPLFAQPRVGYGPMHEGGTRYGRGGMWRDNEGRWHRYGTGMMGLGYGHRGGGMSQCAARFMSFDRRTGMYMTWRGYRRRCPYS